MQAILRVARPVSELQRSRAMYCAGLGLEVIGSFVDHDGFDGVMLGHAGGQYHLELTYCHQHPIKPSPTEDDLLVFYIPQEAAWQAACDAMLVAGFTPVAAFNPYWDVRGRSFQDPDGYRTVLQCASWES